MSEYAMQCFSSKRMVLCYGMIHRLEQSKDDHIRKIVVKVRNHNESVDRFTTRAVQELMLIHPIGELHLMEELGNTRFLIFFYSH